ncbi:uncharacterized protein [Spinacia oleracea]|uniref:3'-5' exonuclease domain-containing protein n=1 Tax=Spinacia oleracea TaxID=3562 RepID=A0A9R0J011_SPIOL|nr:uncharacterized protein LOC110796747 [Spinacia oleracea]
MSNKTVVSFGGANIITTLTNKAQVIDEWVAEIMPRYATTGQSTVVGLDIEWMGCPNFTFVGVEVADDVAKLRDEYGLVCGNSKDFQAHALSVWPNRWYRKPGLKVLAKDIAGLTMVKPIHVCRSDWQARVLSNEQVEYACIDAYASYKIGYKLFMG